MLVLALDTATPAVTAGIVELTPDAVVPRSVHVAHDARKHAELLMPGVLAACTDAGVSLRDVGAVVVGTGPGPFTGLRVGMVTAAALGDALEIPVHGVCTLDAVAADARDGEEAGPFLVVTDARRREVYWAAYDGAGRRLDGPHVTAPSALVAAIEAAAPATDDAAVIDAVAAGGVAGPGRFAAAAGGFAHVTGLPARSPEAPTPAGLVAVAAEALRAGVVPGPLEPLYLRRPDAVAPGARKRVSTG